MTRSFCVAAALGGWNPFFCEMVTVPFGLADAGGTVVVVDGGVLDPVVVLLPACPEGFDPLFGVGADAEPSVRTTE